MRKRPLVLLVDDDRDIVRALGVRLKAAGYDVATAHDGLTGVAAAQSDRPDAIVLDIRMPGMDGLSALARLRGQESTRHIPAIILSANVVDTARNEAMGLGAHCFLEKPCDPSDLLKALRAAIGHSDQNTASATPTAGEREMQPKKSILLADDNQDFLRSMSQRFQELGMGVMCASDGLDVLMLAAKDAPDLIILDIGMPGVDGLTVCEKLGQNAMTSDIPVIILSGKSDEKTLRRCKALGAQYIHKKLEYWPELKSVVCGYLDAGPTPAERPDSIEEASPQARSEPSGPRILVIDDDPRVGQALAIRLGALGVHVIEAPNATSGTYLSWTECPDLIITDQNMPEMSGEKFIVQLKNDEKMKDIPVIVITGQTVNGGEDLGLKRELIGRRGAVAYLTKPVDFNELVQILGRYIQFPSAASRNQVSASG
jgi:CheY-like chemotaxis protein